jgi:hypothetical protein
MSEFAPGNEGAAVVTAAEGTGGEGDGSAGGDASSVQQNWFDGLPEDLRGDASLSRFAGKPIEELAKGYIETKRTVGMDKIVLPKGDDDVEGWSAFYKAAGRPDDAKDYVFPSLKEGETSATADFFRPVAHELGLSQRQLAGLDAKLLEFTTAQLEAQQREASAAVDALAGELKISRDDLDARLDAVCTKTGLGEEEARGLVKAIGNVAATKWVLGLGEKMGEPGFVASGKPDFGDIGGDPDVVREQLLVDQDFQAKLAANDGATIARWKRVQQAVAEKRTGKKAA